MNKKLLAILPAFLLFAVVSNAQEKNDTVKVNQQVSVDTVIVKDSQGNITKDVDTIIVKLGKKGVYVHEDKTGNVSVWTSKGRKRDNGFHSHLDGFGIGINTFFNNNGGTSIPVGPNGERYDLMNLNHSKSINVVLNLTSVSQPISKYVGLTAGIGTEWHNYRFDNDITLVKEAGKVNVVALDDITEYSGKNIRKTKLTDWWLNVPVAIEFNGGRDRSMYASFGVVGSILLNSHSKIVVDDHGKKKDKVWNSFYLNPFRASLMAKLGYHDWGIYATYSLTQMFQDGKGPELYPFAAGVTLNF